MQPPCLTGLGSVGPLIRGPAGMAPGRGDGGPERPRGATRPPAGRQLQGVRVLIVEDEALVAINLETMLEDLGGEVCGTAAAGQEAVRKARQLRPQLAVVDVRLKDGETGIEAARVMAEELGIAIVFASAHSDPRIVARMETVAGAGRLTKPYDIAQLVDVIHRVVRRQ